MNKLAMVALTMGLSLVGCKKANKDAGTTGSGSAAVTTGSGADTGSAGTMAGSGSGSGSGSATAEAPKPKTGADLAEHYKMCMTHINDGQFDGFKAMCLDDAYVGHQMGATSKAADVVAYFTAMRAAMPDFKLQPQVVMVNGRTVIAVVLETGMHSAALKMPGMPELPATNKKLGALLMHKLAFNDANKATEEWVFADSATMLAQLGVLPKEAGPRREAMEKGLDGAPIVVVSTDDAKEKANLEVTKQGNDAFNAHKASEATAAMADDAVESDQAGDKDVVGKKEIDKGAKAFMAAFSDGKFANLETYAAGDFVVNIGTFEGTNDGDMMGMKKTGKKVAMPIGELSQFKDGKVVKLWRFWDSMDMAKQMGMMPDMPAGGAGSGSAAAPADGSGSAAAPAAGSGSGDAKK